MTTLAFIAGIYIGICGCLLFADVMRRAGRGDFEVASDAASLRLRTDPMPMTAAPSPGDA